MKVASGFHVPALISAPMDPENTFELWKTLAMQRPGFRFAPLLVPATPLPPYKQLDSKTIANELELAKTQNVKDYFARRELFY
jgi:hypothetical protein